MMLATLLSLVVSSSPADCRCAKEAAALVAADAESAKLRLEFIAVKDREPPTSTPGFRSEEYSRSLRKWSDASEVREAALAAWLACMRSP